MKVGDRVLSYESLKKLRDNKRQRMFEVKILLGSGIFTRKAIYPDTRIFSYIDDSEIEFKSEDQYKKFWSKYFGRNTIIFDGWV